MADKNKRKFDQIKQLKSSVDDFLNQPQSKETKKNKNKKDEGEGGGGFDAQEIQLGDDPGDPFSTGMPVTLGQAAWDKANERPAGYYPINQEDSLRDMTDAAEGINFEQGLGQDVGPDPFGGGDSHPDHQQSSYDPKKPGSYFKANPNADPKSIKSSDGTTSVRLAPNRGGSYLVKGQINGHDVTFIVDTGASVVHIPGRVARLCDVEMSNSVSHSHTANGVIETKNAMVETLSVGALSINAVQASVNLNDHGNKILLGMSALKHFKVSLENGIMVLQAK